MNVICVERKKIPGKLFVQRMERKTCHLFCCRGSILRHIKQHMEITNSENSICHICGKTNLKRIKEHLRDHLYQKKFKCPECPKDFNRKAMVDVHIRVHTGERPFVCEFCSFAFGSSTALSRHLKLHSKPKASQILHQRKPQIQSKRYKCDHCNVNYSQKKSLIKHMRTEHCKKRVNPIKAKKVKNKSTEFLQKIACRVCKSTFLNRGSLHMHLKTYHPNEASEEWAHIRSTVCLLCNETFSTAQEYIDHKIVHAQHQCSICMQRFINIQSYTVHMNLHSKKERPFVCQVNIHFFK